MGAELNAEVVGVPDLKGLPKNPLAQYFSEKAALDKKAPVPQRTLYTGARMPAIGLGTFGSDHVSPAAIAEAVKGAVSVGYRHIDCASVYGNEDRIGHAVREIMAGGVAREELWITSKLWNDKHAEADVIPSFRQSLADLQLDYLDMYLVHWPFPNFHPPGCDVSSRSPDARPYIHENFMKTWRQMEKLVDLGLVRHIGTSNMTIPKLKLLLRDAHQTGRQRNGTASAFPAAGAVRVRARPRHRADRVLPHRLAEPAGARPHARGHGGYRRPGDRGDRPAPRRASGGGLRQVGRAARPDSDSVFHQPPELHGQSAKCTPGEPLNRTTTCAPSRASTGTAA